MTTRRRTLVWLDVNGRLGVSGIVLVAWSLSASVAQAAEVGVGLRNSFAELGTSDALQVSARTSQGAVAMWFGAAYGLSPADTRLAEVVGERAHVPAAGFVANTDLISFTALVDARISPEPSLSKGLAGQPFGCVGIEGRSWRQHALQPRPDGSYREGDGQLGVGMGAVIGLGGTLRLGRAGLRAAMIDRVLLTSRDRLNAGAQRRFHLEHGPALDVDVVWTFGGGT